jgi:hypothetical protein
MSDFSELESELKKLRPARVSAELMSRIAYELSDAERNKIIWPESRRSGSALRINWLGLGLGLAAAAAFLILARVDFHPGDKTKAGRAGDKLASATPTLEERAAALPNYQPTGLTQVVYGRHDEGLVFPRGATQPARRVWTAKRETLRWRDPDTGAQLAVSYPAEEITLIPVSGQ